MGKKIEHRNNFNVLRLLAAYMVIVGHMYVLMGHAPEMILSSFVHEIGVFIFFLVGGYLITKSYLSDPNIERYSLKRIFRIFPALISFVLFVVFIAGPLLTSLPVKEYFSHPATKVYLMRNILLFPVFALPGVFEGNPASTAINGSLWTLPIEFAMYIIVPLLLNLTGVRKKKQYAKEIWMILTGLVFVASQIRKVFFPESSIVIYGTDLILALNIIPYYFIGSMFAICVPKEKLDLQKAIVLFLFSILVGGNLVISNTLLAISLSYLVFSIAFATEPKFVKVMQKHEISYGLYLYGFLVQQLLLHIFGTKLGMQWDCIVYLVLSTTVTIGFAYISAICVEEPCNRMCKKILYKLSEN